MRRQPGILAVVLVLAGALAATNCSAPDLPRYGSPNSLQGKAPPVPPVLETTALPCNGGKDDFIKNEPACAKSWSKDIHLLMKSNGKWGCAEVTKCHGGTIAPKITDNSDETWDSLRKYPLAAAGAKNGSYINPCSKDKGDSGFLQNVQGQLGSPMPKLPGTPLSTDEATVLETWITCGAVKN